MIVPGAVDKKYVIGLTTVWILALCFLQNTVAQISSSTADYIDTLSYMSGNPAKDPLFVFYQPEEVAKSGSLTATYPDTGTYNFEWRRYNPAISGFDPAFNSESGSSSSVSNLEEGGYTVRIWDGIDRDTTFMSWIMLDHFRDSVAQTQEGTLPKR